MSKKSKQKSEVQPLVEETEEVLETSLEGSATQTPVEEAPVDVLGEDLEIIPLESAQVLEAPADDSNEERVVHSEHGALYDLEEAAQKLIQDFHPGWLPSIKAYAKSHGLAPQCPLNLWSWLFKSWGAVLNG